jgi:hypothetical protein
VALIGGTAAPAAAKRCWPSRGHGERRAAGSRKQAFAAARTLLDQAEHRDDWHRGEIVSVEVRQADE